MTNADLRDLVVLDTNVLLAATDRSHESHGEALALLNHEARRLALTPQIVREYLAIATRPDEANGLSMPGSDAAANMEQYSEDIELLPENITTSGRDTAMAEQHTDI